MHERNADMSVCQYSASRVLVMLPLIKCREWLQKFSQHLLTLTVSL